MLPLVNFDNNGHNENEMSALQSMSVAIVQAAETAYKNIMTPFPGLYDAFPLINESAIGIFMLNAGLFFFPAVIVAVVYSLWEMGHASNFPAGVHAGMVKWRIATVALILASPTFILLLVGNLCMSRYRLDQSREN